jgi:hypothetical protein
MKRKKISPPNTVFPDGEGFNALPIAFVYTPRAARNEVRSKCHRKNASTSLPLVAPLSAKITRGKHAH